MVALSSAYCGRAQLRRLGASLAVVFGTSAALPFTATAAWGPEGMVVAAQSTYENSPQVMSDGSGGTFVVWCGDRTTAGLTDILAQRLDASGTPLWGATGITVCAAPNNQTRPRMVADGNGGMIVAWTDYRGFWVDIYAQRLTASGAPVWLPDGVAICTNHLPRRDPELVGDGNGGAIVTWHDERAGWADIYVQRLNASGVPQWTVDGVLLTPVVTQQFSPQICSDGGDGAVIAWDDTRNYDGDYNYIDIYAQRVDGAGIPQWTEFGKPICFTHPSTDQLGGLVESGGSVILVWAGFEGIFAQRVDLAGNDQWQVNGVRVAPIPALGVQWPAAAPVSDGNGGAVIAWQDARNGTPDIYAQRMNAAGGRLWTSGGVPVCVEANWQKFPALVGDGNGGAYATWYDDRDGVNTSFYAQRLSDVGWTMWQPNGIPLAIRVSGSSVTDVSRDATGGVVLVWEDIRNETVSGASDVYAQRLDGTYGYWGRPEPIAVSATDIQNDQGGKVSLHWRASGRDLQNPRTIGHYSIWRVVSGSSATTQSSVAMPLTDIRDVGIDARGPLYASVSGPAFEFFLEFVGTQSAHGWPSYAYSAPTLADSIAGDAGIELFAVAAHDQYDHYVAFLSNVVAGYSVDNLAPPAPLFLTAQRVGPDVQLKWGGVRVPDLRDYSVFRATSAGVQPVPGNFLSSEEDTILVDANAPTTPLYYVVAALDVHGNQSVPSNEANVGGASGIGETPAVTQLTLRPNTPNPFSIETRFRVGLPVRTEVTVEIYDVAGRRVAVRRLSPIDAGWHDVAFDGRDDAGRLLASGVYFSRVTAAGQARTQKLVIHR
jgi:hypothetical protein